MGIRSVTKVHAGGKETLVILALYRQYDGYFEGMGKDLQDFLRGMVVVNGIPSNPPEKAANGMDCLAAQLVAHFKKGIGNIYITDIEAHEEYNYDIYLDKNGKLVLEGEAAYTDREVHTFDLNDEKVKTI